MRATAKMLFGSFLLVGFVLIVERPSAHQIEYVIRVRYSDNYPHYNFLKSDQGYAKNLSDAFASEIGGR